MVADRARTGMRESSEGVVHPMDHSYHADDDGAGLRTWGHRIGTTWRWTLQSCFVLLLGIQYLHAPPDHHLPCFLSGS